MSQNKQISGSMRSALAAVSIISNSLTTYDRCRAVYIGTSQSLDFSFDGVNWVTFQGCVAGTVLPIEALAAQITSGTASPAARDVVFLY